MADKNWPSRRDTLKALEGIGLTSVLAGCNQVPIGGSENQQPRNVVLILSDDHRYDFMSFLDEPKLPAFLDTPNMNRMADEGAHFSNAFVSTSLCGPSRATILTGQFAHTHRVINNTRPIPTVDETFPEQLQNRGYETAFIGKWHLFQNSSAHPQPGFDQWVSFQGQGQYFDPTFNVNGQQVKHTGYITDLLTKYALDWLRKRDGDRPFFLFLSHKAVHHPWEPAPRHKGRYADVAINRPETIDETTSGANSKPEWVTTQRSRRFGVENRQYERLYRRYCETLLSLDESVGAVMDHLDESERADSTLMLYMSDNGFLLGEHGLLDKRIAYEPSIRIPLLAYAPGLTTPQTKISQRMMNVDIAPTVLDIAGQSPSDETVGRSFIPLLTGDKVDQWRDMLLYEYFWSPKFPHPPGEFAVRTKNAKYVMSYGRPAINEFYDLKRDPRERHNRITDDAYQTRISRLQKRLFDRLKTTDSILNPVHLS